MKNTKIIVAIALLLACAVPTKAQNVEDALRFANPNGLISARAAGLGLSFHGVADDGSAMYFNPAGLSLVAKTEFSIGLGYQNNAVETDYLGNKTSFKSNDPYISNISMVAPFKMSNTNNGAVALGYTLETNFDNSMDFSAYNTTSSFINDYAQHGPNSIINNFATYQWLAGDDFKSPINKNVQQSAQIDESGGIHNITGALAFDLSDNFAIGFNLTGNWGTFKYNRIFEESDINNMYQSFVMDSNYIISNVDFNNTKINENIEQAFTGITGSVGFQGRVSNHLRYGMTIKFPTYYEIEDNSSLRATTVFDNSDVRDTSYYYTSSYNVSTPWIFCFGLSGNFYGLTLSTGVEFQDATQLQFSETLSEIEALNITIRNKMDGRLAWGLGAEYEVPGVPLILRASYNQINSAYKNDIAGSEYKTYSFGIGAYVAPNVRLDAVLRSGSSTQTRTAYSTGFGPDYTYQTTAINFGMQLTYRY